MKGLPSHQEVFLNPGEFYFGDGNVRISTLLGSCVSITLWHPGKRHGGMCHFMLDSRGVFTDQLDGRYADEAMELFMLELKAHKTHPSAYKVRLFGGGKMFAGASKKGRCDNEEEQAGDVGARNIEAARHLTKRYGFKVAAEDVGGNGHRRIMFDLWSGDVWVKFQERL